MAKHFMKKAYVVGSGSNGLTAGIELARAGYQTTLIEAQKEIGGGVHSAQLTLPDFIHDVCSAIHPLALSSPAFQKYPLHEHGLQWIQPTVPLAHPLENGEAAALYRSIEQTTRELGNEREYRRVARIFVQQWPQLMNAFLKPMLSPSHPFLMARFGLHGAQPAIWEGRKLFAHAPGRALFAGLAAHSALPLSAPASAAFGLVLGFAAHAVGWPLPRGGSQSIANALGSYFQSLGGTIITGEKVRSFSELNDAHLTLCNVGTEEFLHIAGERLPDSYARSLKRFRRGPGAFKVDWALSGPVPWRNETCRQAGTVHVGGSAEEVAESEAAPGRGETAQKPFVLFVQSSLFDRSRAPGSGHTGWAYCHVPNGCREDMTDRIEAQIERFAPGFRQLILGRHVTSPAGFERMNPNFSGGDILGGAQTPLQIVFRPNYRFYKTPLQGVYLCSSSTPPGGGVHGMCGYNAVQVALAGQERIS